MAVTNFQSFVGVTSGGTGDVDKMAQAFDKLSQSIDKANEQSKKVSEHPGFDSFAAKVKQGISDPLGAIGSAAETALKAMGPVGAAVSTTIGIFTAAAAAGFEFARGLGELGDRIGDTSVRLGLSIKDTGDFSFAMKRAGGDISGLEGVMRKLSQGLADNSEAGKKSREGLRDLGINAIDAKGNLAPMSNVLLQLSQSLNAMQNGAERNNAAIKIMGKSALEVLPDLLELEAGVKRARELGLSPTEEEVKKWDTYQKEIAEVDAIWEKLKRDVEKPLAATVIFTWKWFRQGDQATIAPAGNPKYGEPEPPPYGAEQGLADQLFGNKGLYAPALGSGNVGATQREITFQAEAAKGLGSYLKQGLIGAQEEATRLKKVLDEARTAAEKLAESGQVNPQKAHEVQDAIVAAAAAYQRQADIAKELAKDEEKRVALLERQRDLIRQGHTFYTIGTGPNAFILTDEQIGAANVPVRGQPSLFRRREINPYASTAAILGQAKAEADLQQGLQVINGEQVFIAPTAARGPQIGGESVEQLDAREKAAEDKRALYRQAQTNSIRNQLEYTTRIIELRAGPGGEVETAKSVAAERQQALQKELEITGDIVQYREESQRNQLEFEVKIAELQRKRLDELRTMAGGLFDALLQGPAGIQSFFTGLLKDQARKVFENVAVEAVGGKSLNLGLPGKIFQGTLFGQDPLKQSAFDLTSAAYELKGAARALATSPSGGGGGLVRGAGSFGGPYADFGGGSSGGIYEPQLASDNGGDSYGFPTGQGPGSESLARAAAGPGGASSLGRYIGAGAAIAGGGAAIYAGVNRGGAQGALTGAGGAVGVATGVLSLALPALSATLGPIGMAVGMGLGLISSFLGDPKVKRANELALEATSRHTDMPTGTSYSTDLYGGSVDMDYQGGTRFTHNSFSIQALDSQSLESALKRNPGALASGVTHAINSGNAGEMIASFLQA